MLSKLEKHKTEKSQIMSLFIVGAIREASIQQGAA